MKKKILKYVLIGVSIYVAIFLIEFCIIYAVKGDDTWNYFKEYCKWYSNLFFKRG